MRINPIFLKDFYKVDHARQYPKGVRFVYSNFTPRISRIPGIDKIVVFGIQGFIEKFLVHAFIEDFFKVDKDTAVKEYKRRLDTSLGKDSVPVSDIEALWDLQYLPIQIKALPEGTKCPLKTPVLTIVNTHGDFGWLTNSIESLLSCELWHPMTTATIAYEYRKVLDSYAKETSDMPEFVQWQGHDFSMRGSTSVESSMKSGAAHLLSFTGTDTIPAIDYLEKYYEADCEKELVGGSVPATEHAVMCLGGKETEIQTFKRLICDVYPKGIVSIVSDTWNFWDVLTKILPELKPMIMARDGKVVIRPDSGDPVKIICGDDRYQNGTPEHKGAVQLLWETFGGTYNNKGFRQIDSHIGLIYGDSITLERCKEICEGLKEKGFASTNVVFGIGSYTYQYVTRDTFGFAMKATWGDIDGSPCELYKAPATDSGMKNSARGLLRVNEDLTLSECVSKEEEDTGMLQTVFINGTMKNIQNLSQIRNRLLTS